MSDNYVKLSAAEVERLCLVKLADIDKERAARQQRWTARYYKHWWPRIWDDFFKGAPKSEEEAAERWRKYNCYPRGYWERLDVEALLGAAQALRGGEMFVTIGDFESIRNV